MVNLIPISISSKEELKIIKSIYFDSFPEDERRPWDEWLIRLKTGRMCVDAITDSNTTLGFISYWNFKGWIYIEHFAISSGCRSGGIGSCALKKFLSKHCKPTVVEVEKPSSSKDASRRVQFYNRLGFEIIFDQYIQPPYQTGLNPLPLDIMATQSHLMPEIYIVIRTLYNNVYGIEKMP